VFENGDSALEDEAINEAKRQDVGDAERITTAVSPKTAPATKVTITRLYSISLPVCGV
jgi:hypothetical protein